MQNIEEKYNQAKPNSSNEGFIFRNKIKIVLIVCLIFAIASFFYYKNYRTINIEKINNEQKKEGEIAKAGEVERSEIKEIVIEEGDVFSKVAAKAGMGGKDCYQIYEQTKNVFDLAKLKIGNKVSFYLDASSTVGKIIYSPDAESELTIEKIASSSSWSAKLEDIIYEIKAKTINGEISSSSPSLYQSALEVGADERMILQFAESLEWNIDFANDPQLGDKYRFIYEERYRDGKPATPGRVLAGYYLNGDKKTESFYFEESADNKGYFDSDGNSVQKMFLRAPLAFKYISSPFTTGRRYIEAFNISTGHRAVDYAATFGTPIRAVADGTVIFASYNGPYGNMVKVQHNSVYTTNYGHMSKFAVKRGARVKQGQVIGYVGSTGLSTGPHLHYEMVKNGVKINPLKEVLPPGKPIKPENKERFQADIAKWREKLDK